MKAVFFVPGPPCGKGRPRVVQQDGESRAYTPQKTKDYEWLVALCYRAQCHPGETLTEAPVRVEITAVCPIPASASKKERRDMLEGRAWPTKKPDVDNMAKIILDALSGVAYRDDKQVVQFSCAKHYGEKPGVLVGLEALSEGAEEG